MTIYDFRQVHLESVKNAMLSPVKTFDLLFNMKYVFYQSQINTENCFWCHFHHKLKCTGCFCLTIFCAYDIIQAWCGQNKLLK